MLFLLVVMVSALAGISSWIGLKVKDSFQQNYQQLSQLDKLEIKDIEHEPSVFQSTASVVICLKDAFPSKDKTKEIEAPCFNIEHKIQHHPFISLFQSGQFNPQIALVNSYLKIQEPYQEVQQQFFGDDAPIRFKTKFFYNGDLKIYSHSPQASFVDDEKKSTVNWSGFKGYGIITEHGTKIVSKLLIPSLKIQSAEGLIALNSILVRMNQSMTEENLWLGKSMIKLDEIHIKNMNEEPSDEKQFKVSDFFVLTKDRVNGDNIDMDMLLKFKSSMINALEIEKGYLKWDLKNIEKSAFIELKKLMSGLTDQTSLVGNTVTAQIMALLKNSPLYHMKVAVKTQEGTIYGRLDVKYDANSAGQGVNIIAASNAASGDAFVQIPQSITRAALKKKVEKTVQLKISKGEQSLPEGVDLNQIVEVAVSQQINTLLQQGYMRTNKENYIAKIKYENGNISLNRKKFPIIQMLMMSMSKK